MKINWEVRIKNKAFWVSLIPMLLLLIQTVAAVFGFKLDFGELGNKLLAVVEVVFSLLALLGGSRERTRLPRKEVQQGFGR